MSVLPGGDPPAGIGPPRESAPDPIEAIDLTVGEAAGAMQGLQGALDRLGSLLVLAREGRENELRIDELFIRAQDYVNQAVADADERSRKLIAEAETEAARIVAAATQEAYRMTQEAHEPAGLPLGVIQQLQRTIDEFARVNGELLSELSLLMQTFGAYRRPEAAPMGTTSGTAPSPTQPQAVAPLPGPPVDPQASPAPTAVETMAAPPPPWPVVPPPQPQAVPPVSEPPVGPEASPAPMVVETLPPPPPPPPWSAAPPPPPPPPRYWDGVPLRHADEGAPETPSAGPADSVIAS